LVGAFIVGDRESSDRIRYYSLLETDIGIRHFESGDTSRRTAVTAITDRNAQKSYSALFDAFKRYFDTDYENDTTVSRLTQETVALQRKYGFNDTELAASYVIIVHGGLINTVPTLFWMVIYIFSRPDLLNMIRKEISKAISIQDNGDTQEAFVDYDCIGSKCPLLLACLRETQRLVAVGTLHRRVLDNIMLSDGSEGDKTDFLLTKGTSILIPVSVSHRSVEIWGPTPDEFQPERFLKTSDTGSFDYGREGKAAAPAKVIEKKTDGAEASRMRKRAYFPFGGGKELCPGRKVAAAEILGAVTVLISGFNLTDSHGQTLKIPRTNQPKLTNQTARAEHGADLSAKITRREGWEHVVWKGH
jgi:cytochrome P450